jgi:hypothetical protein
MTDIGLDDAQLGPGRELQDLIAFLEDVQRVLRRRRRRPPRGSLWRREAMIYANRSFDTNVDGALTVVINTLREANEDLQDSLMKHGLLGHDLAFKLFVGRRALLELQRPDTLINRFFRWLWPYSERDLFNVLQILFDSIIQALKAFGLDAEAAADVVKEFLGFLGWAEDFGTRLP